MLRIWGSVRPGLAVQMRAATPAAIGEAKLVPLTPRVAFGLAAKPASDGTRPTGIWDPGAQRSTLSGLAPVPKFEKGASAREPVSRAPTQITPLFSQGAVVESSQRASPNEAMASTSVVALPAAAKIAVPVPVREPVSASKPPSVQPTEAGTFQLRLMLTMRAPRERACTRASLIEAAEPLTASSIGRATGPATPAEPKLLSGRAIAAAVTCEPWNGHATAPQVMAFVPLMKVGFRTGGRSGSAATKPPSMMAIGTRLAVATPGVPCGQRPARASSDHASAAPTSCVHEMAPANGNVPAAQRLANRNGLPAVGASIVERVRIVSPEASQLSPI